MSNKKSSQNHVFPNSMKTNKKINISELVVQKCALFWKICSQKNMQVSQKRAQLRENEK